MVHEKATPRSGEVGGWMVLVCLSTGAFCCVEEGWSPHICFIGSTPGICKHQVLSTPLFSTSPLRQVSISFHCCQNCLGDSPARNQECGDRKDLCLLWAQPGLHCDQDTPLGSGPFPAHFQPHWELHEECGRGECKALTFHSTTWESHVSYLETLRMSIFKDLMNLRIYIKLKWLLSNTIINGN